MDLSINVGLRLGVIVLLWMGALFQNYSNIHVRFCM